jgi:hypothetical protein
MLRQRRWEILHKFENKHKKIFLKKLSVGKSLEIFKNLYLFAQEVDDRADHRKLDLRKIHTLSKVHFMFMKVNL